jgi:tetratricopeptide (TPR) repeat protein
VLNVQSKARKNNYMRVRPLLAGLLLCLFGVWATPADAQQRSAPRTVLDDPLTQFQAERGLAWIYNMQFDRARPLFDQIDRRHPQHPIGPFLKALSTWWTILLDLGDESNDARFIAEMEEVIRRSDRILRRDRQNFDAMFFKGAALGFRGRLRSNRGDWYNAAMDGRRAMSYVLAVGEHDRVNADYAFGKGIYDYFAALVPQRYPFARPVMVFFPRGDRDRGIALLERTARDGRYIQTEAIYFLLQIFHVYENDFQKSLHYVQRLRERHPNNPFFHTYEARIHARWGQWPVAIEIFEDVLRRARAGAPGYNDATVEQSLYFLGRGHMAYGRHQEALTHLRRLNAMSSRRSADGYFQVLGLLRLGMAYDALGRRNDAIAAYQRVLRRTDHSGAHEVARHYLRTPFTG